MERQYTNEQFWKLYKDLPQELKDVLSTEKTGTHISEACDRNGVSEKIADVVHLTGSVLVGLLSTEEFSKALEKEAGIKKNTAQKIGNELNRFIFYPVRPALERLRQAPQETIQKEKIETVIKPSIPPSKDLYKESIEEEE